MGGNDQAELQEETPLDAVLAPIARYFKFAERGTNIVTESRAGLTTFMVMAYIIFVNPSILGAGFGLKPDQLAAYAAATALIAGIMTIAMGVVANYPLRSGRRPRHQRDRRVHPVAGKGLTPAGAMGVIVLEGIAITILVVIGLREAIMAAVPLALKRSIGVGIGLFILFIGFVNGGLIVTPQGGSADRRPRLPDSDRSVRLLARPADHARPCTSSRFVPP